MMNDADVINRRYYALMILGIILPFLLTPFLSLIFYEKGQSYAYLLLISRFTIWGILGLMLLYAKYAELQPFLLLHEERQGVLFYIQWVILLYLMVFSGGIIAHIPYWLGLHEKNAAMQRMNQAFKQYPALGIFTAITAGISEELFFRGYVMGRLSLLFKNKNLPVIISALLFASIHLGYKNLGEIIFTLVFGLIFGYHYQKYRNIKVLIVVHFLVDLVAVMTIIHRK
jgi:membrane protease YdiL (CAAX protease family)